MSTAAQLDINIDQGSDYAAQIYWTTGAGAPFFLQGPMRMEIRDTVGGVALTLQTSDTSDDDDADPDQTILFNEESGLIQLYLSGEQTDLLSPDVAYVYDLFCHYLDSAITGKIRKRRLIAGRVHVFGRTTQNV